MSIGGESGNFRVLLRFFCRPSDLRPGSKVVIPAKAGGALQQRSWSSSDFGFPWYVIARLLAYAAGVSSACRRPRYFSLLVQRKSNQKKRPPGERALRVRERVTGFFDSTSCAGEKLAGIPASHPAGCPSRVRSALRGPGLRARAARGARTPRCRFAPVEQPSRRALFCAVCSLLLSSFKSARSARKGSPYAVSERGTRRPAGESAGMPIPFRQGRSPGEKSGPLSRSRRAKPGEHRIGVPFLWVTFLDSGHPCPTPFGPASLFANAPACAWARKEK
jgi:hypothetical protein